MCPHTTAGASRESDSETGEREPCAGGSVKHFSVLLCRLCIEWYKFGTPRSQRGAGEGEILNRTQTHARRTRRSERDTDLKRLGRAQHGREVGTLPWCSRGPRAPTSMGCCSRRGGARRLLVGELVGERVERRLERRNEVLLVFDANRQPHEPVRDANLEPVFREHVCMRHHGGARADRLERAEVLAERPRPLDRIHERAARRGAALDLEPEHAAVQAVHVLPVGELLLREGGEPRVANHVHLWMPLEELGNGLRVFALLPHAQRERLCRLQRVEGVLRAHDVSVHVLHVLDALVQLGRGRDHRATHRHVVPIVVLCGGLDDKIDTMVDGPLKDGRREGRVAGVKQAA
mmetsp:Transcript_38226/g.119968  ORF Transcript_38226/g.119968 Transcript_38226/m.119968 type:complete len:348 (-) Transcript_38226:635-1678(-)